MSMALNIRDPRAHDLAREVAQTAGETMTEAVVTALAERLERLRAARTTCQKQRADRLLAHGRAFAALPVHDPRPVDEIHGYDEVGLPR
jgi:antitoxin VapB